MLEDQRPGAAYWIDHYVVPTFDTARWGSFYTDVMGVSVTAAPASRQPPAMMPSAWSRPEGVTPISVSRRSPVATLAKMHRSPCASQPR